MMPSPVYWSTVAVWYAAVSSDAATATIAFFAPVRLRSREYWR